MSKIRKGFALFLTFTVAMSCLTLLVIKSASAQNTQNGEPCPLVSGVYITSPTNTTYTVDTLWLNFSISSIFDDTVYQYDLTYSLDGKGNVSIPSSELSFSLPNGDTGAITICQCSVSVGLPQMDAGTHQLDVYATFLLILANTNCAKRNL